MCAASLVVQGSDGTVGANKEAIKIIAKGDDAVKGCKGFAQVCAQHIGVSSQPLVLSWPKQACPCATAHCACVTAKLARA